MGRRIEDLPKATAIKGENLIIVEDTKDTNSGTMAQVSKFVADDNNLDQLKKDVQGKNTNLGLSIDSEGYIVQEV